MYIKYNNLRTSTVIEIKTLLQFFLVKDGVEKIGGENHQYN